jgi:hypothetical protein
MDDLTAQERELIMTFRRLSRFTVIGHRNARWRIGSLMQRPAGQRTAKGRISGRLGIAWTARGNGGRICNTPPDTRARISREASAGRQATPGRGRHTVGSAARVQARRAACIRAGRAAGIHDRRAPGAGRSLDQVPGAEVFEPEVVARRQPGHAPGQPMRRCSGIDPVWWTP